MTKLKEEIFDYFPCILKIPQEIESKVQEIRVRLGQPITFKYLNKEFVTDILADEKMILSLLENFTNNSVYAVQSEINSGFITIKGGHRIGICGEVVIEDGKVKNIKNINSLNIRVANQVIGVADSLYKEVVCNGRVKNTLIVSPPRIWKNNNA